MAASLLLYYRFPGVVSEKWLFFNMHRKYWQICRSCPNPEQYFTIATMKNVYVELDTKSKRLDILIPSHEYSWVLLCHFTFLIFFMSWYNIVDFSEWFLTNCYPLSLQRLKIWSTACLCSIPWRGLLLGVFYSTGGSKQVGRWTVITCREKLAWILIAISATISRNWVQKMIMIIIL